MLVIMLITRWLYTTITSTTIHNKIIHYFTQLTPITNMLASVLSTYC